MPKRRPRRRSGFSGVVTLGLAIAVAGVAFLSSRAPSGEPIVGRVSPIDGDSFRIDDTEIRLHAVDAFEGRQTCGRGGSTWACGRAATNKFRTLTDDRQITCIPRDLDSYGRTVAVCRNGDADLGAEMVRSGLALAYRQYGNDYVDQENEAKAARHGAWAGEFVPPWDWRHSGGDAAPSQPAGDPGPRPPNDCEGTGIKGNINERGDRIYHVPGSRSYEPTRIDESRGERWFCTERDAQSAGWRAPRG